MEFGACNLVRTMGLNTDEQMDKCQKDTFLKIVYIH